MVSAHGFHSVDSPTWPLEQQDQQWRQYPLADRETIVWAGNKQISGLKAIIVILFLKPPKDDIINTLKSL